MQPRRNLGADEFYPDAYGVVRVVVVQPDGKILLGGDFTTLSPNGGAAVTPSYCPAESRRHSRHRFRSERGHAVHAIAVQSDGKILVGGAFI